MAAHAPPLSGGARLIGVASLSGGVAGARLAVLLGAVYRVCGARPQHQPAQAAAGLLAGSPRHIAPAPAAPASHGGRYEAAAALAHKRHFWACQHFWSSLGHTTAAAAAAAAVTATRGCFNQVVLFCEWRELPSLPSTPIAEAQQFSKYYVSANRCSTYCASVNRCSTYNAPVYCTSGKGIRII